MSCPIRYSDTEHQMHQSRWVVVQVFRVSITLTELGIHQNYLRSTQQNEHNFHRQILHSLALKTSYPVGLNLFKHSRSTKSSCSIFKLPSSTFSIIVVSWLLPFASIQAPISTVTKPCWYEST